jgi:hypothetical protein
MLNKYVIIGQISPIVFKAPAEHRDMVLLADKMRNAYMLPGGVTSGGYYTVHEGKVETCGGSYSVAGLVPAPGDAEILQKFLEPQNFHRGDAETQRESKNEF